MGVKLEKFWMMGNNKVSKDLYEVYACKYNDEVYD